MISQITKDFDKDRILFSTNVIYKEQTTKSHFLSCTKLKKYKLVFLALLPKSKFQTFISGNLQYKM